VDRIECDPLVARERPDEGFGAGIFSFLPGSSC
jgi:hypothetical protein